MGVIAMRCQLCSRRGVAVQLVGAGANVAAAFRGAGLAELPFRKPAPAVRQLSRPRAI